MASITCIIKKTGKSEYFSCWILVPSPHKPIQIFLTNSMATPVPLLSGAYDLMWEFKGEIGTGVEIDVRSNGVSIAKLSPQLITQGNRIGSGSDPKRLGYAPLHFVVP